MLLQHVTVETVGILVCFEISYSCNKLTEGFKTFFGSYVCTHAAKWHLLCKFNSVWKWRQKWAMVTEKCLSSKIEWMMGFAFEIRKLNHCWSREDIAVKSICFGSMSREKMAVFVNLWLVLTKPVYCRWIELLYRMCCGDDKISLRSEEEQHRTLVCSQAASLGAAVFLNWFSGR